MNKAKLKEVRLLLGVAGYTMREAEKIQTHFRDECALLDAEAKDLESAGLNRQASQRLVRFRDEGTHRAEARRCESQVLIFGFPGYPSQLMKIPFAPPVLFCRGNMPEGQVPLLAVVGARRCTPEGMKLARSFGRALARLGVTVVSGLARGIDAAVMRACLDQGGRVIGVLGCGLDRIYPQENSRLFLDTIQSGALITEFPLATPPQRANFPRRNRIISGLALGVLVVEASNKSGSLITVDHALDQGRVVMAVPGPVGPPSFMGTNRLIRDGACVVLSTEDIMAALSLPMVPREATKRPSEPGAAGAVLAACRFEALTLDAVAAKCGLSMDEVFKIVSRLEVQGRLVRVPGGRFLEGEAGQRFSAKK